MKFLSTNSLSTQARYRVYLIRKKEECSIFAKKKGRGFTFQKVTLPFGSEEYLKEVFRLEADGWSLVIEDD